MNPVHCCQQGAKQMGMMIVHPKKVFPRPENLNSPPGAGVVVAEKAGERLVTGNEWPFQAVWEQVGWLYNLSIIIL